MKLTKLASTLATWIGSFTGSVERTVNDKLADVINARDFGATGNGTTDDTAALCAALDAANGNYSVLVQYGTGRNKLVIPKGTYKVSTANLTGMHALLGRLIIRCDLDCQGVIPLGEFTILHSKSINVCGLSCKELIAQGVQFCHIENIDTVNDFVIKGSTSPLGIPGLANWGGGSYWNNVVRVKAGTTSASTSGKFSINIFEGSVNQNTFQQIAGVVEIYGTGTAANGGGFEGNANTFIGVDTSGSSGYVLDNRSVPAQHNTVIGLYGEVEGTGRIRGPWTILGARVNYGGWLSTMSPHLTVIGTDPTAGQQGGECFSTSAANLCPSGDWSVLNETGVPVDYKLTGVPSSELISFDDALEPSGSARYFGVANASVRCRLSIELTKTQTGYIRGAFYFRGDTPVEIAIEDIDNPDAVGTTIYMPVDKFFPMGTANNWKLYRVSAPTTDKSKRYRLRITVDAGKTGLLGGSFFSAYNGAMLPTFAGWHKTRIYAAVKPNFVNVAGSTIPLGTVAYRKAVATVPASPVVSWHWNGTTWLSVSATA